MRHRLIMLLMVFAVAVPIVALPAGAGTSASVSYPVMKGRTIVKASGTSGAVLQVPKSVTLSRGDIDLKVEGSEAAYVQLSPEPPCDGALWGSHNEPSAWCLDYQLFYIKDFALSPMISVPARDPKVREGLLEIYIVSNGPVTLTLTVDELNGETAIEAGGEVAGRIARIPTKCPQQAQLGCANFGYGGLVGDAQVPGLVGAYAYVQKPTQLPAGTVAAHPCIYPNRGNPKASLDPSDHPSGCDFADGNNSADAQNTRNFYLMWTATTAQTYALATFRFELATQARHYTGFVAHQAAAEQPVDPTFGRLGGFGLWLGRGITCPTGDYSDC